MRASLIVVVAVVSLAAAPAPRNLDYNTRVQQLTDNQSEDGTPAVQPTAAGTTRR